MPRVGSSNRKTRRFAQQPLREHDLLLIPPGKVAHDLFGARRADAQFLNLLARRLAFAARIDELVRIHELGQVRERRILANGHSEHQALRLAVFGNEGDAGSDTVRGPADPNADAVDR